MKLSETLVKFCTAYSSPLRLILNDSKSLWYFFLNRKYSLCSTLAYLLVLNGNKVELDIVRAISAMTVARSFEPEKPGSMYLATKLKVS